MRRPVFSAVFASLAAVSFGLLAHAATGTITRLSNGSSTDQQNAPAISGTGVVWTDALTPATGASNFDIFFYDLSTGAAPLNLTNTPTDQEFLEDIDGTNAVWTHTSAGIPGDIVVYDLARKRQSTAASSTQTIHFEQPAIRGNNVTFLAVSTQIDVVFYDNFTGNSMRVTDDAATQGRPRAGADYIVYEDYASGNADVYGWQISTLGPPFAIATGPAAQVTPDIDGNHVVFVETASSGGDQIFLFDLGTGTKTQLTTVASSKIQPRISGNRIVWADDRNGALDVYTYDLSTGQEQPLVSGVGDQYLADIDGDRVVYTSNEAGFEQVYLFTFAAPNDPPVANAGADQTVQYTATLPTIQLDGCASTDDGKPNPPGAVTFHWDQVGGNEPVALSNPNVCNPTFVAPPLGAVSSDVLTFRLTVSDSQLTGQATVNITVVNADRAPECHATAPAAVAEGTPSVALDGSSSFDPDGDPITSQWVQTGGPSSLLLISPNAPVSYFNAPLLSSGSATYTFALTVSDGELSSSCSVAVAVEKLDHCPVPDAGAARTVKEGRPVVLDGTASSDVDGDTLLYSWVQTSGPAVTLANAQTATPTFQAPLVGPSGADLVFQLTVDDQAGCAQSASVTIHVTDVGDAPTCGAATASPGKLWPPNRKLASVHVTGVDDNDLRTTISIDSVFQDEPVGDGDGDRDDHDAVILGSTALVRAERAGNGDGRVYHVRFTATNAQGSCTGDVTVCVPRADRPHATCVDEGPSYDSVAP